jgi:hypothetical protein
MNVAAGGRRQNYVLSIDKEGRWFYNGREITHPAVLRIFNDGLFLGTDGCHYLRVEDDLAVVEVADAPFVVTRVTPAHEEGPAAGFRIRLSDKTDEMLDLTTLEIDEKNVPYCTVKKGMRARFASRAYYMLAEHIGYDEKNDAYYVRVGEKRYQIPYRGERE